LRDSVLGSKNSKPASEITYSKLSRRGTGMKFEVSSLSYYTTLQFEAKILYATWRNLEKMDQMILQVFMTICFD